MKFVLQILSIIFLLIACNDKPKETPNNVIIQDDETAIIEDVLEKQAMQEASGFKMNDLLGHYTNEKSNVTIHIDSIINNTIYGKNTIKNNPSTFSGTINLDSFEVTVQPSKNNEGMLNFSILNEGELLKGTWKTSKEMLPFELHKQ